MRPQGPGTKPAGVSPADKARRLRFIRPQDLSSGVTPTHRGRAQPAEEEESQRIPGSGTGGTDHCRRARLGGHQVGEHVARFGERHVGQELRGASTLPGRPFATRHFPVRRLH